MNLRPRSTASAVNLRDVSNRQCHFRGGPDQKARFPVLNDIGQRTGRVRDYWRSTRKRFHRNEGTRLWGRAWNQNRGRTGEQSSFPLRTDRTDKF